jgi:DtxR family transcriptional regulator, Mn-dependent transcriptional regulator
MSASNAMQEYLAEAYRLAYYQEDSPYISTSALAKQLGVSAPAVTRMVQRLKDEGLLEHEPYRGIYLTPAGEREALMNIRRHRLVEAFLVHVMQFADNLGGLVSDEVVSRMEQMTGFPRRCPHGEPIPTAAGYMPRVKDAPLNEAIPDSDLVVSRVNTHDIHMLKYLSDLGLKPGTRFHLMSRAPFNGPLQLRIGDDTQVIGHELAGVLRVCGEAEFELA